MIKQKDIIEVIRFYQTQDYNPLSYEFARVVSKELRMIIEREYECGRSSR